MIKAFRILSALGSMARLFSFTIPVPILVAFAYEEWTYPLFGLLHVPFSAVAFAAAFLVATMFWLPVRLITRRLEEEDLQDREAYAAVALGWLGVAAIAALPFLFSGSIRSPVDAFFEAMSGITTTGASAMQVAPEDTPAAILFWRALLQWLGGLGFVVLLVALLAGLTQGGSVLMQAEAGGGHRRIRPKLRDTAMALWKAYVLLSAGILLVYYLLMARVGLAPKEAFFDALIHTFTTFSTGGFSNHTASIGFYGDVWIEAFTILVMVLGATQFTLYLPGPRGFLRRLARNPQWRFMVAVLGAATVVVAGILVAHGGAVGHSLRHAAFATTTMLTGTGHSISDFASPAGPWPVPVLVILLILMHTGGNAGSTSGAIKSGRFVLLAKAARREFVRLLHPRAVSPLRMENRVLREDVFQKAVIFVFVYITIWAAGAIVITVLEPGLIALDGASASAATLGNVGLGLGAIGPAGSFAQLGDATKLVLTALMWIGRLEIFTVLLLFYPKTWRN